VQTEPEIPFQLPQGIQQRAGTPTKHATTGTWIMQEMLNLHKLLKHPDGGTMLAGAFTMAVLFGEQVPATPTRTAFGYPAA